MTRALRDRARRSVRSWASISRREVSAPTNFAEAKVLYENGLYAKFFHAMLERGVALAPGAYEILFVSLAHTHERPRAHR